MNSVHIGVYRKRRKATKDNSKYDILSRKKKKKKKGKEISEKKFMDYNY